MLADDKMLERAVSGDGIELASGWAWVHMTGLEQQAVRNKAAWEHMTLSAVMLEWPSLMIGAVRRLLDERPLGIEGPDTPEYIYGTDPPEES